MQLSKITVVTSKIRVWAPYWYIAPLLCVVVGLQLGLGLIAPDDGQADFAARDPQVSPSSPRQTPADPPTLTLTFTPSPTETPTSTASPTRLPPPTDTPLSTRPVMETPAPSPTLTYAPTETYGPEPTYAPAATPAPTYTPTSTPEPTPTYAPTPTPAGQNVLRVPILMYHYLSTPPAGADVIRRDLSVSPAQFAAHLAYLRQAGYETISLKTLAYAISQHTGLPDKPVIITFDDGYRDHYENAFPLLRKYNYTATFFIFTQPVDTYNVSYLTWEMVVEMHQAGMEFGAHSYTHPDLTGRDVAFLVSEILGPKEAIEQRIGDPVRFFAYPAGRYDNQTIEVLQSAGYWGAITTQWGSQHSFEKRFEIPRLRIRGSDTAQDLAHKLNF